MKLLKIALPVTTLVVSSLAFLGVTFGNVGNASANQYVMSPHQKRFIADAATSVSKPPPTRKTTNNNKMNGTTRVAEDPNAKSQSDFEKRYAQWVKDNPEQEPTVVVDSRGNIITTSQLHHN